MIESYPIMCPSCNGRGFVKRDPVQQHTTATDEVCPACHGSKTVIVTRNATDDPQTSLSNEIKHSVNPKLLKQRIDFNQWDNVDTVIDVIDKVKNNTWFWHKNMKCKYINVRIDMRDGGCIIEDRYGNRILPEDLTYQYQNNG
jgi:hypothetical protein